MRAFRMEGPGAAAVQEVPDIAAEPGEALLRVKMVGMCGTDLNTFRGRNAMVTFPRIPGHEVAAEVVEAGGDLAAGTMVTISPYTSCGRCPSCLRGRVNACQFNETMGVQREGAMIGRVVVPAEKVILVTGLSQRDLALVEPCAVGFHAVRRAELKSGETVVVLGCGMIGLGVILGALRQGAKVIAIDLSDAKLDVAKKLGAHETINASTDVKSRVAELTGEGPDVVVEAVGAEATFLQAVDLVATAGRVVYIGYAKAPIAYETKYFITKELDIRGSRNALRSDFDDVIDELRKRPDAGDLIVTRTASLDEAAEALADWHARPGDFTKILVKF
ncbi:MAG: zinc-binding alcohol dehydrogenase family protein [Devosia sp.]|nr:zinc-binding alcohol dehydrogenase family protein [Devosia sp.]